MIELVSIEPIGDTTVFLTYSDGLKGEMDLSFLFKNFIYSDLSDPDIFKSVYIDEKTKDVFWKNKASICKDTLYNHLKLLVLAKNFKLDLSAL